MPMLCAATSHLPLQATPCSPITSATYNNQPTSCTPQAVGSVLPAQREVPSHFYVVLYVFRLYTLLGGPATIV